MEIKKIILRKDEEYITLNILLKLAGIIDTGGMVKFYLSEHSVLVNGEEENRRGRKLYENDKVEAEGHVYLIARK